jgi:hypothetical protein
VIFLGLFAGFFLIPAMIIGIGVALYTWLVDPISAAISELKEFLGITNSVTVPLVGRSFGSDSDMPNQLAGTSTSSSSVTPIGSAGVNTPTNNTQNTQVAMDNNITIKGSLATQEDMARITTQLVSLMKAKYTDELLNSFDTGTG